MAQRGGQGASTLSQAAGGERLPTLPVVLAYVRACGGDPEEWEKRWRQAAAEVAAEPRAEDEDVEPPYRGLARFEPGDADLFFGRDELTDRLVDLTRSRRFTAVFGPSGSGKSSLLRAGLIPRLRTPEPTGSQPAALRVLTPGEHPLRTHGQRLIPKDSGGDTWLIVDQFEELYTLCTDAAERNEFIDRLLGATSPDARLQVVIAVRADFLGRCAEHPGLTAALQDAMLLAGPMGQDELREAIVKPAQTASLIVERSLTASILAEVEDEPGALPLMSHALLETWRRRNGRALTLEVYEAAGGLRGAIARTAEDTYARLTPAQTNLARRIMLRLVTPGEGTPDTRRPTLRTELDFADLQDTAEVLEHLARARLLTLEHGTVDLAHEALITAWPRLQSWINEARDRLRLHRQLTEAARTWNDLERDPGAMYRGTRLAAAEETFMRTSAESELTFLERDFLTCSVTARQREEEAAGRTTRRLRQFTVTLSILLVLALTAGLIAWQQYRTSEQQREQALTAQRMALSRQLAAQSAGLLETDPDLASLLAVQAYRTSRTKEATVSLLVAAARPLQCRLTGHTEAVKSVAFSPDGRTLASGSNDTTVRLWDTATGRLRTILRGHTEAADSVAFSPDGRTLASAGEDKTVRLWDAGTGHLLATWNATDIVRSVAFSPDGRTLASGEDDGKVRLWDVVTGRPRSVLTSHTSTVWSVAFSPDGRTLASGGDDKEVRLWDPATGRPRTTLTGPMQAGDSVVFAPDGRTVATGSGDGKIRLWDVRTGRMRTVMGGQIEGVVTSVAFSPDGQTLASGGLDGNGQLWDVTTGGLRTTLNAHIGDVWAVAFSPDGRTLATGGRDNTVRLWDAGSPRATLNGTYIDGTTAFSPDGHILASGGVDPDGRPLASGESQGQVQLWDASTGHRRATLNTTNNVESLAFSPDSRILAVGREERKIQLWEIASGRLRASLDAHTDVVRTVVFSPDGRNLASGGNDGKVRLWDVATGGLRATLTGHTSDVWSVAFSPDGRTLASGSDDGTIRSWDVATGHLRATRKVTKANDLIDPMVFSPDGNILASGGNDGKVRLWDVATGGLRATLTGRT
ncbi:nSTAND1 domain-containing NTPase, partial [Streptomyces sp. NPDC001450]